MFTHNMVIDGGRVK